MARRRAGGAGRRESKRRASVRWTEADARQRLEAWRASGSSLMGWCRREGVSSERLRYWRVRLGDRRKRRSVAPLLPVELVGPTETAFPFELELPRGLRLRIAAGFDGDELGKLISVVEARP